MVYQFVVLVCSSIQNTSHLSIVLGLTFRISKPIKFSSHFTNNIVIYVCSRAGTKAFSIWGSKEERQPSVHLSRGVFSGSSNFLTLFRCKPVHCHNCVLLSQTTLYIFGEQLGFVSQNGLDCFAFVPSCNQGKLLLSTTNDNFKTLNWMKTKPGRI